ncbi:cytochrome-c peroxidase [Chitinophaga sp. LS1]|uniref:cytochrome-c peroxidase n=1 Tax=Chitinophaga sp. LS1 TaxID=3051176 RepID=UPI002AAC3346|nr:cytochrome c peroxidase [Chitinophaga sp. LS1]WPV63952.1 cytochrome c peroxidase [Chitinophaga sp. LS1]
MKRIRVLTGLCLLLCLGIVGETPKGYPEQAIRYFKEQQVVFASKASALKAAIEKYDVKDPVTVEQAKEALKECRIAYKRISFFLEYFFVSEAYVFNTPAKYEVEEPYIEYEEPVGLQQIEALLYSHASKEELMQQADIVAETAAGLPALLYNFKATDAQVMESIQLELIRIQSLYITGYDAPSLQCGVPEAAAAMDALRNVVGVDSIRSAMSAAFDYLHDHPDFNSFDRLTFITDYAMPVQRMLSNVEATHTVRALNTTAIYGARDAFKKETFTQGADITVDGRGDVIRNADNSVPKIGYDTALGRRLFFEKKLSGNRQRSCATCHLPEKHFTDGMPQNASLSGGFLPRNTPSLLYATYQYAQFWDGRAKSLEEQIDMVLHSPAEMGGTDDSIVARMQMPKAKVIRALAAYIRTLTPFNSPFDHYTEGDRTAMTSQQKHGFNIFMGKARCGSCHFAPLFNGLTPPLFNRTEFEILGVPLYSDLQHPVADTDRGRIAVFPITFYEGAFKTPTVRNAAATAPFMHHGNFSTMQQVIDFYNQGGVTPVMHQTLSSDTLGLDKGEQQALISFLEALVDGV